MPLTVLRQDITKLEVDAIVNAGNQNLVKGDGVSEAIFIAAGEAELTKACSGIGPIERGEAVATPGFRLPAKYIIHTAGPMYKDGEHGEPFTLRSCYKQSLYVAIEHNCKSVAFPLISTGLYNYPHHQAAQIAIDTINDFLHNHQLDVYLTVFDDISTAAVENVLNEDVEQLVSDEQILDWQRKERNRREVTNYLKRQESVMNVERGLRGDKDSLVATLSRLGPRFTEYLLRVVERKEREWEDTPPQFEPTQIDVFRRARLTASFKHDLRVRFPNRIPKRPQVMALIVALELNLAEANELLRHAGMVFLESEKLDMIIKHFVSEFNYDREYIDGHLIANGLPPLAANK